VTELTVAVLGWRYWLSVVDEIRGDRLRRRVHRRRLLALREVLALGASLVTILLSSDSCAAAALDKFEYPILICSPRSACCC